MTTLLIDADIFAFKASSACEGVYYFGGSAEAPCVEENLDQALSVVKRDLEATANTLKATRLIVCLTDEANFRTSVFPDYKGNRKDARRPSTLKAVKDYLAKTYETYQRPSLEADDCMGILATHKTLIPGKKIIVSSDKDMQTVPGLLFNPNKDKDTPRKISEMEANRYFMQQTLTGDPTDGYPGLRGCGPKSPHVAAVNAAVTLKEMWEVVRKAYVSKGQSEEDALVQARCARILRASDWDFQSKQVRLWSPPA